MQMKWQEKKLQKIAQRLKSVILQDFEPIERERIKGEIGDLEKSYTNGEINFDEYKIKLIAYLGKFRSENWLEQFLYREVGNFLTEQEKFTILTLDEN